MASALLIRAARRTSRSIHHGSSLSSSASTMIAVRSRDTTATGLSRSIRAFATSDAAPQKEEAAEDDDTSSKGKQSFVTTQIEPQEWDAKKTDPLHRPKYRSRTRLISKHEYARQPGVTFEDQYDNFADAMVVLSWMDHPTQQRIYQNYLNWMVTAQEKFGKTSHEYICRLLAQKFHITPQRAAAIIQLQHNEEQKKLDPDVELCEEEAALMDEYLKNTIQQAYRSTGEEPPESFVEPPTPEGGMESYRTMIAEDLMDVDQLVRDANVREQERARIMINDHVYVEDVDDDTLGIHVSKETKKLMTQKEKHKAQAVPDPEPSPTAKAAMESVEEQRPRWQYVAQIIDTRELYPRSKFAKNKEYWSKKTKAAQPPYGKKHRMRFLNNWTDNTLIEHDGELRVANLAEVKKMPWKPVRDYKEFTYKGVKKAWLDRTVRGKMSAWGKAVVPEKKPEEKTAADAGGDGEEDDKEAAISGEDGDDSSSSSSGESSDDDSSSSSDDDSDDDESSKDDDKTDADDDTSDTSEKKEEVPTPEEPSSKEEEVSEEKKDDKEDDSKTDK